LGFNQATQKKKKFMVENEESDSCLTSATSTTNVVSSGTIPDTITTSPPTAVILSIKDKDVSTLVNQDEPVCPFCMQIFGCQENLARHQRTVHQQHPDNYIPSPVSPSDESPKYIVNENLYNILLHQFESEMATLKYIRNCVQNKTRGGSDLLYRIYFEGRNPHEYPLEVIDIKSKKVYYRRPNDMVLDDNLCYLKSILIENLRNCYLHFCHQIISSNLEDNDVLFDEYDLREIQRYVMELSDDKKKERLIMGLLERVSKVKSPHRS